MKFELMGGLCSPCGEVQLDVFVVSGWLLRYRQLKFFEFLPTVVSHVGRGILLVSVFFLIEI